MRKMLVEVEWFYHNVPEASKKYYQKKYLEVYSSAADILNNGIIDELNEKFKEEVGTFENYDNPTYNNWMAVHMTQAIVEAGILKHHHYFRTAYYNSKLVLVCARSDGRSIRMELVPGSEKMLD